jgi:hypothetical protein
VIPKRQQGDFRSTTSSQHEKSDFNIQNFKHKSNTDKTLPKPEYTAAHRKRYGHKPARHKDHNNTKNNMENHRSLKRTLLQAEIQKNNEKQTFTYSDSKQNSKEIFDLLPSANMENQIST